MHVLAVPNMWFILNLQKNRNKTHNFKKTNNDTVFLSKKALTWAAWFEIHIGTNVQRLWIKASELLMLPGNIPQKICGKSTVASSSMTSIQVFTWSHTWSGRIRDPLYIRPLGSIHVLYIPTYYTAHFRFKSKVNFLYFSAVIPQAFRSLLPFYNAFADNGGRG